MSDEVRKEQERVAKKEAKREKMMNRSSYRIMVKTAKYMDQYYLDPLIGLIPGGVGDVLSSSLAMPFIYYSLCVVRSIPLTLAVIYNVLLDVLIGAIPLTSSLRHPKILIKEFSYFLMPCHQHGLRINLLV